MSNGPKAFCCTATKAVRSCPPTGTKVPKRYGKTNSTPPGRCLPVVDRSAGPAGRYLDAIASRCCGQEVGLAVGNVDVDLQRVAVFDKQTHHFAVIVQAIDRVGQDLLEHTGISHLAQSKV